MDRSSFSGKITGILLRRNAISQEILQKALDDSHTDGKRLEEFLVEKKLVSETDMTLAISEYLGWPPISLARFTPNPLLIELIPRDVLKKDIALPIAKTGKMLTVALGDPFNMAILDELQTLTGHEIVPLVAFEKEVKDLLQRFVEAPSHDLEDILKDVTDSDEIEIGHQKEEEVSLDQMLESAEGAPVIRLVNSMLVEALRRRASDIHIEPMEKTLRLRYRIDGDLYEFPNPPKNLQSAIISRIKIMSDLNIAERRIPQDGRCRIKALGKEVDIRVSILPLIHGEKIVMRILDKSSLITMANMGLDPKAYDSLMYSITQPHGVILVTGPTGSGKTTTLYSCLQELNKPDVNIVTTEDPVEYQLVGVNQVQINDAVDLTFANALRSILRQDPDIVLVGEIRDGITADIAVKAAITGHLVLSTLHTNDAATAVTRLRDMGVESFLLGSSIIMTQAQRLYKKLCSACKKPRELPLEFMRINNIDAKQFEGVTLMEPGHCPKCNNTGYKGRGSLMEIMMVDEAIRRLIVKGVDAGELGRKAVENGMMTLRMVGLEKVKQGLSSLEEMLSVTGGGVE